ncbi:MAG: Crp/Fnr family transcriptional regulator [Tyzzerella sp.]|nr:Crp/Fnr family transcriptional regulator [Tyzzerella sp.]
MKKYFEILRKCSLFDDIADENLMAMLGCLGASVKNFHKKEMIMAEGEPAIYIGILLTGAAQIEQTDYYGNRSIVAGLQPSELFGETFACAGVKTMPVDVVANEDTEIMFIDCLRITQSCSNACEFHRQMIYNLMKVVATKNLVFHQKIVITSKRSTREKLMAYLLLQAKKNDSNSFGIPYDRQGLADYLGVERSGLSAEISKLRKEGMIECKRNHFELL